MYSPCSFTALAHLRLNPVVCGPQCKINLTLLGKIKVCDKEEDHSLQIILFYFIFFKVTKCSRATVTVY